MKYLQLSRCVVVVGLLLVLGRVSVAQEKITLSAPETKPNNTGYTVGQITQDIDGARLLIRLKGDNGERLVCVYSAATTPTGATLLTGLNKADLSSAYNNNATTGSLRQRIYHRLVIMNEATIVCGKALVGSLTGNPQ